MRFVPAQNCSRLPVRMLYLLLMLAVVDPSLQTAMRNRQTAGPDARCLLTSGLKFNEEDAFQIAIFEDLHFGEDAWDFGPAQDVKTVKVIGDVLDSDPPDLVVLNGDLITGENTFLENSTVYLDQIVGPIVARGLPWASTYGNHDYQNNISGHGILAREQRYGLSLTRDMVQDPDAGVSNYFLPVYPHGSPNAAECAATLCPSGGVGTLPRPECVPELLLWFFDSRGGFLYQRRSPDGRLIGHENWVHESAVTWFRRTHERLTETFGRVVPSLAFTHIPPQAARALAPSFHPNRTPGFNDDAVAQQAEGWCPDGRNDGSCPYGGQDVPFMRALVELPGVMALFFAHDHGDSWCHRWEGMLPDMAVAGNGLKLCFGQHSGYGGYGRWVRGARQVRVTREMLALREAETWIRLETGHEVARVVLNETYGRDVYPPMPTNIHSPSPSSA